MGLAGHERLHFFLGGGSVPRTQFGTYAGSVVLLDPGAREETLK